MFITIEIFAVKYSGVSQSNIKHQELNIEPCDFLATMASSRSNIQAPANQKFSIKHQKLRIPHLYIAHSITTPELRIPASFISTNRYKPGAKSATEIRADPDSDAPLETT